MRDTERNADYKVHLGSCLSGLILSQHFRLAIIPIPFLSQLKHSTSLQVRYSSDIYQIFQQAYSADDYCNYCLLCSWARCVLRCDKTVSVIEVSLV